MSLVVFALLNVPTYIVTVATFQRLVSVTNRFLMTSYIFTPHLLKIKDNIVQKIPKFLHKIVLNSKYLK